MNKHLHRTGIFYGWYIVAISFVCHFMATGSGFYIMNTFMQPLCELRGWTRTEVNLALAIGGTVGLLSTLLYGTLVTRIGPRILMAIGPIISALALILIGSVRELHYFYICYVFLYLGNGAMNGIVSNTAVNNWFVDKRGKAMGMSTAGISLSGAILPFAALLILEVSDIPRAFLAIGIVILAVFPVSWLVIRNRPEDHGLLPDGTGEYKGPPVRENGESLMLAAFKSQSDSWPLARLVRETAFWKVGIAYAFVLIGVVGVMSQLKPRFSDVGFDDRTAMAMMAATALMGTFGKYFWGMLCDRFDAHQVVAVLMAATSLGLGFALFKTSTPALVMFIIVFGFAMGGVMSTLPIIVADLFGREAFPSVLKFVIVFLILQYIGTIIMGQSFDRLGSYDPAYQLFILLNLAAALLILSVRRPKIILAG